MDEQTWREWEAVYEAPLGEESWSIYRQIESEGLECIWSLELLDGSLWALVCNLPHTQDLPREARRAHLHLSLCFERDGVWPERLEAVRQEWHGRAHILRGWRQGAAFYLAEDDPVSLCPYIHAVHSRGGYRDRELHISM
jgi:hypothetical protein